MNSDDEIVLTYQLERAAILHQLNVAEAACAQLRGFQLDELCDQIRRLHDRLYCLDQSPNRFQPGAHENIPSLAPDRFLKRLAASIVKRMNIN